MSDERGAQRRELEAALESAAHLTYMDGATVELARAHADHLDAAFGAGYEETHRAMYGPTATYHKILASLGLNPEGRQKLGLSEADEDDEMSEFEGAG